MSASRLKIVQQPETDAERMSLDQALDFARPDDSPFRMLSEAVQSFETLQRRCEAAERLCEQEAARHTQAIDAAEETIGEKQKRIDYLEALLADFKMGLQSLARDAGQQAEELRASQAAREELTVALAHKTDELRRAQQRNLLLEKNTEAAQAQHKLMLDFADRQGAYLANQELKIAAETQALHEARMAMRTVLDQAGRLDRRPLERTA